MDVWKIDDAAASSLYAAIKSKNLHLFALLNHYYLSGDTALTIRLLKMIQFNLTHALLG